MSKALRFSRWRRLPGAHRVFEKMLPTHAETLQRFTVYLPGQILEHAEALARLDGVAHAQAYCEGILTGAIQAEVARRRVDATPPDTPTDDEISNQADNVARDQRGSGSSRSAFSLRLVETVDSGLTETDPGELHRLALPRPSSIRGSEPETVSGSENQRSESAARVLQHAGGVEAGVGEGFLDLLRRGHDVSPKIAAELLSALNSLETELRGTTQIDRRLARALFRLAFEAQVLITDAWPMLGDDPSTLALVRRVQESAERVLSGADVRYERLGPHQPGGPP